MSAPAAKRLGAGNAFERWQGGWACVEMLGRAFDLLAVGQN
jgi:hypothetical protein